MVRYLVKHRTLPKYLQHLPLRFPRIHGGQTKSGSYGDHTHTNIHAMEGFEPTSVWNIRYPIWQLFVQWMLRVCWPPYISENITSCGLQ